MANSRLCSVSECGKPHHGQDLCSKHYLRLKKHGSALQTKRYEGMICQIEGCNKACKSNGLCQMHYMRKRRHGSPMLGAAVRYEGCEVHGCYRPHNAKGLCKLHYDRLLATGDVREDQEARIAPGERLNWLIDHMDYDGEGCLLFPYSVDHNGYGRATHDGKQITASRMMTILVCGDPPSDEHQSAHSCGKGHDGCVHPQHLRWDTCEGNHADKIAHGTVMRGTDCHAHKLDEGLVRQLRALEGRMPQREIAEKFGLAQTTVSRILRRVTWGWVSDERNICSDSVRVLSRS